MSLAKEGGTRPKECPLASVWVHKSYPRRSPLRNVSRIPVPPGHPLEPSLQGQSFRVPASRQMWSFGGRQGDSCLAFLGCWALWGRDRPEPLWTSPPRSPEHQSRLTSPWGEVRHRWPFFPVVLPHKVLSSPKENSRFSATLSQKRSEPGHRPARPLPRVHNSQKDLCHLRAGEHPRASVGQKSILGGAASRKHWCITGPWDKSPSRGGVCLNSLPWFS